MIAAMVILVALWAIGVVALRLHSRRPKPQTELAKVMSAPILGTTKDYWRATHGR